MSQRARGHRERFPTGYFPAPRITGLADGRGRGGCQRGVRHPNRRREITTVLDTRELTLDRELQAAAPASFELYLEVDAEDMLDARDVLEQVAECVRQQADGLRLVSYGVRAGTA